MMVEPVVHRSTRVAGIASSPSRGATNVSAHPTEQVLPLSRCRCPDRLEVCSRPAELDIGVAATPVRIGVEVQKRFVPQVKVWARAVAARHVDEAIDGAQRLDEFHMCHPFLVLDLFGDPLGQWGAWSRTAVPVRGFVETRHRTILASNGVFAPANVAGTRIGLAGESDAVIELGPSNERGCAQRCPGWPTRRSCERRRRRSGPTARRQACAAEQAR